MNQEKHIEKIMDELEEITVILSEKYNLPTDIPFEKCISSTSMEEILLNDGTSIYDQLDSIYKKDVKNYFNELKKINLLGNPKLSYYKDNSIKITSNIIDTLWFDGKINNIDSIRKIYLKRLKAFLEELPYIKYVQYILDIPGLKLEIGNEKINLEDSGIIITFPFEEGDVDSVIDLIKPELKNKKMEFMSSVLLLRQTNNDMYIPQKYEDYHLPKVFEPCLDNFYINSIYQSKFAKVFFQNEFVEVFYLSSYEFMNNKTNKPFCYFYIRDNQLLDMKTQESINKILRLQDSLE